MRTQDFVGAQKSWDNASAGSRPGSAGFQPAGAGRQDAGAPRCVVAHPRPSARQQDFSAAPPVARGGAEFVGETEYRSLRVMWQFFWLWRPMYRRLKRLPGYRCLHWWYRFPRTLGMVVFFDDQQSLYRFARGEDHAQGMLWLTTNGRARASFIRIYDARPAGYTNGAWRTEAPHASRATAVAAIRRFTPLAGEDQGPLVTEAHR